MEENEKDIFNELARVYETIPDKVEQLDLKFFIPEERFNQIQYNAAYANLYWFIKKLPKGTKGKYKALKNLKTIIKNKEE